MRDLYGSVVITGGGGLLAAAVRRELTRRGRSFVAVGRAECDIADPRSVGRLFRTHRPTLLIHCAAWTKVDACEGDPALADAVNGHAVGWLADEAKAYGTKLVHVGTDFIFDGRSTTPYAVDHPAAPLNVYGRSKLLGERHLRRIDPPGWLLVRTAWLFGPGGNCFPSTLLEAARAGQPIPVVSDQVGSPTYTRDLAEVLLDLSEHGACGTYHCTNAGRTSWFEFAREVCRAFSVPMSLVPITAEQWRTMRPLSARRPSFGVLSLDRAEALLGRAMRSWQEGLLDYAASPLDR